MLLFSALSVVLSMGFAFVPDTHFLCSKLLEARRARAQSFATYPEDGKVLLSECSELAVF